MRRSFRFKSIRSHLTYWFLIISMFPLIVVSITIYNHMADSMKVSIFNKLESNRDLKVIILNNWFEERIIDIHTVAAAEEMRLLEKVREGDDQHNITVIAEARAFLDRYLGNHGDFEEIFVISPYTKKIMVSTSKEYEGTELSNDPYLEEAVRSRDLLIEDIHYSKTLDKPCMALSLPIVNFTDSGRIIGILFVRINLETSLYDLLSNQTGMGKTGETLIVNKNGIALNELRWYKNAPLKLKIDAKAAVEASLGKTGIVEAEDYRGEMTLNAYTRIPLVGWGFVAKQDLKEVYAPIYKLRNRTSVFGIVTLLVVIIAAFRVSKSISEPIKILHKGSEIIGNGNLDHRVGTDAKDEIGELSRTFDLMIEKLKTTTASWDELNKEIVERKHLEKTILEIEEHERRRIGHDLHDNLGQQLTGISFKTKGLENILRKKSVPEAEDAARIAYLIEMSKAQVKSLSIGLAPIFEKDEYGLVTAIVELASNSEKLFGITCDVNCDRFVALYDMSALIHLYRIAQEAITNAARHARPGKIEILLSRKHKEITMKIKDDGRGFSMSDRTSGMGLEIMRYRASIINASIDVRSDINKGTIVTCTFFDTKENGINTTLLR